MNPTKLLLILTLSTGCIFGCQNATDPAETTQTAAPANAESFTYEIRGMHCDGCANAIATKAGRVDGVSGCDVSLENGTATVQVEPDAVGEVETAIASLGYTVKPLTQ